MNNENQNINENNSNKKRFATVVYYIAVALFILLTVTYIIGAFKVDAKAYEATSTYSVYDNTDISRESITSTLVTYSGAYQGGSQGNTTVWYIIFKLPQGDFSHQRLYLLIDGDVYDVESGITSDGTYQYVRFAPTANISGLNTIGISFGGSTSDGVNSFEFAEIVLTNRTNEASALSYVEYTIQQLNAVSTDFVVSFDSYSTNDTTYQINQIGINTGVTYNERIYLTSNQYGCYLTLNGLVAMNGGITQYSAYVSGDVAFDPVALENLSTTDDSRWATNFIAENNLDITDYGTKAHFNATFNLTDRVGDTVAVYITATNPYEQTETIVMCLMVYVDHSHPVETDTEIDTDSPIESDTDIPDTPTVPPEYDSPDLQDAYNKGYQQGLLDMQNGVFGDIVVNITYYYRVTTLDTPITDTIALNLTNTTNGLSFKPIYEYYLNSIYNTDDYQLIEIGVQLWFPGAFQFTNNLIYFSGSNNLVLSDMPVDLQVYTLDDSQLDVDVYLTQKGKQFYWTIDGFDQYQLTEAITFRIDDRYKSFEEILVTNYLAINSNNIQYTTNVSSYEKGKADGYDKGYDLGYIKGENNINNKVYEERYREGRAEGYSEGKEAGKLIGRSEAIGEQLNWYQMILAIPDAHVEVIRGLFNFTLFGVNMLNFALSLVTLILLWRLKKFIL